MFLIKTHSTFILVYYLLRNTCQKPIRYSYVLNPNRVKAFTITKVQLLVIQFNSKIDY